jgi:ribosomal protein S12 methylthiotransferase
LTRQVALVNYGCAKNLVDSEVMGGHLLEAGYAVIGDPDRADVLILNTCGFIRPSRDEADQGIGKALTAKGERPGLRVVVTGCYAEKDRAALAARYPGVDAWLGVKDYDRIVAAVEGRTFRRANRTYLYDHESPRALSTPSGWAYLKVSEGCSHECAFCTIPSIKGRYRSRSIASLVAEAKALEARGVREAVLISQDTTYFGRDRGMNDGLARLLEALLVRTRLPWVRFLYGYPEEVTPGLLDVMSDARICPYFDIPFQHADRSVLRRMKRSMDARRALALLDRIRTRLPEAVVRTSLIVGFPGEGRAEFAALKAFIREARFDHLGAFAYSREEGTAAFGLGDPVPARTKERRLSEIMSLQAKISAGNLERYVGRTLDVLLECRAAEFPGLFLGRTRFQAPEVDGAVLVRGSRTSLESPLRRVRITSSEAYDLRGTLLP